MSRIQDILNKAERDGGVRRTRGLGGDAGVVAEATPPPVAMPRPTAAHEPYAESTDAEQAAPRATVPPEREGKLDHRLVAALAYQFGGERPRHPRDHRYQSGQR